MVRFRNKLSEIALARPALLVALLIAAAPALATTDREDNTKGEHGSQATSTSSTSTEAAPAASTGPSESDIIDIDRRLGSGSAFSLANRFRFEVGWELHTMFVDNNLVGNGAETVFEYFYAGANYYITRNDRLSVIAGLYQFALADPGETGWRTDDILVRYSHNFKLPWKMGLDLAGSLIAPTSFASYKMGLVTEPQVRALLSRTFFKQLTVDFRLFAAYYWQTYTTIQGGSTPNPITRTGGVVSVEEELPWHPALAFGVDLETAYMTYYNPGGLPGSTPGVPSASGTVASNGVETNPIYTSQPLQQDYGFDVYVRYDLPKYYGVKASVEAAYAQGEPTGGYTSDLVDGVSNLYLFYPESSQFFVSVNLKF